MVFKTSKGDILFDKNARINASTTIPKSEDWYDLNNKNDSRSYYFKNGISDLINKLQIEIKNNNIS